LVVVLPCPVSSLLSSARAGRTGTLRPPGSSLPSWSEIALEGGRVIVSYS
jgi:hypothetical protein